MIASQASQGSTLLHSLQSSGMGTLVCACLDACVRLRPKILFHSFYELIITHHAQAMKNAAKIRERGAIAGT